MNNIRMATIVTVRLKIALSMQCVEAVSDRASPDFSLVDKAVHMSCSELSLRCSSKLCAYMNMLIYGVFSDSYCLRLRRTLEWH
jgi:hypothetical protein